MKCHVGNPGRSEARGRGGGHLLFLYHNLNGILYVVYMSKYKFLITAIVISVFIFVPFIAFAQIKITEIMYDPQGSDTKREWIEVFNSGAENVDLNTYFFFENNIYHKLVAQTESILKPGEFAIIVDSIAEVVTEYKEYMGKLFDSAFSLNNTGETISMADNSKQIIDTVTYDSSMGANNDGNSLQVNNDKIIHAQPTFGRENATENYEVPAEDSSSDNNSNSGSTSVSTHTQPEPVSNYTPSTPFKISAGRNRLVLINTPVDFKVQISKADINPRVMWNLGDFSIKKGKNTTHIYEHEGIYEVVAEAKNEGHTSIARTEVTVMRPNLLIVQASSTIQIKNESSKEVNLGGFSMLFDTGKKYTIPRNSIIKAGATIHKIFVEGQIMQEFVYPNGEIYQRFDTI